MVIVNVEDAIRKIINESLLKEAKKKNMLVDCYLLGNVKLKQKKKAAHFMCCFLLLIWCGSRQKNSRFGYYPFH